MNNTLDKEIKLKLLYLLKEEPRLTQREMNKKMGVSLGKVNYCISAFIKKGMIRVEQFKNQGNKTAYMYHVTPKGIESLGVLTLNFLKLKIQEYDGIKKEIKILSEWVSKIDPKLHDNSELLENLNKILR